MENQGLHADADNLVPMDIAMTRAAVVAHPVYQGASTRATYGFHQELRRAKQPRPEASNRVGFDQPKLLRECLVVAQQKATTAEVSKASIPVEMERHLKSPEAIPTPCLAIPSAALPAISIPALAESSPTAVKGEGHEASPSLRAVYASAEPHAPTELSLATSITSAAAAQATSAPSADSLAIAQPDVAQASYETKAAQALPVASSAHVKAAPAPSEAASNAVEVIPAALEASLVSVQAKPVGNTSILESPITTPSSLARAASNAGAIWEGGQHSGVRAPSLLRPTTSPIIKQAVDIADLDSSTAFVDDPTMGCQGPGPRSLSHLILED